MRTVIRPNVFETNSSSEHALVIDAKSGHDLTTPISDVISSRCYSFSEPILTTPDERLQYLWTAIVVLVHNEEEVKTWKERIINVCNLSVDTAFENNTYNDLYPIDNVEGLYDFLRFLKESDGLLYDFIYGNDSEVVIGYDDKSLSSYFSDGQHKEDIKVMEDISYLDDDYDIKKDAWQGMAFINGIYYYVKSN